MDRDNKGRFVEGHENVGAGRKKRAAEVACFDAFKTEISLADLRSIAKKLKELAIRGDKDAIKLILSYLMGLPIQRSEVTGAYGEALKMVIDWSDNPGGDTD